ncbi:hypothetical protein AB0P21_38470 [Kribbella sp. NPDC056861]|uniref:hypothetical protein n=1 Tax=Kribbella sp. NPDC056861 TaxID=3154857 RepID=UPI003416DD70
MTSQEETLLTESLDRQAAQAPDDRDLLNTVRSRLRRRRSGRAAGSLVLACAAVATGIFGVHSVLGPGVTAGPDVAPATQISPGPTPTEGWRWESYRTIQLQVPSDWTYGTTDRPACMVQKKEPPYVGRPGMVPSIGCQSWVLGPAVRSPYLWFASSRLVGSQDAGDGWVEETREFDNVKVTVFAGDAAQRRRIFDTVTPIVSVDGNGCPPVVPIAAPRTGNPLATVGAVRSISVCSYGAQVLTASSTLPADRARSTVAAILAAPRGGGPNKPECTDFSPVDVLLLVKGSKHDAEVTIRYSQCTDNGTFDGTTTRRLARSYLEPLLTGAHALAGWTGESGLGLINYSPAKSK